MPIDDPTKYTDKTDDWMTFFHNVRRRELSSMISAEVIAAHREDPRGQDTRHSEALQQLLNHIHNMPTDGKSFVYAETPHAVYKLGIMHARGLPPTIFHDTIYPTEKEAVHAVFLQRLEQFGITSERNI